MKKRILAFLLAVCACISLCITAGAVRFESDSYISIKTYLLPVLEDSAKAMLGLPDWRSYNNHLTLKSYTTVTAYSSSSSDTASNYCTNDVYILEGWRDYTGATAYIRSMLSANASFTIYADTPSATQTASWVK